MCRGSCRRAGGFTLVEMLVVIAVIGILVALTVPAIQAARESSRRARCENNLRQLAVACQNHATLNERFPSGGWGAAWTGDPNFPPGHSQPGGWVFAVLPYLEAKNIHSGCKTASGPAPAAALAQAETEPLAALICPSRRRAEAWPSPDNAVNAGAVQVVAKTDYAANGGPDLQHPVNGSPWWGLGPPIACATAYSEAAYSRPGSCCVWDHSDQDLRKYWLGVVGERSEVTQDDVRRGLSQTLLLAEKRLRIDGYKDPDAYDGCAWRGSGPSVCRWTAAPPLQDDDLLDAERFGGPHRVLLAAYCDGSVRSVDFSVDAAVWKASGSRR
jgi:prepilin-type N-terminal cleavage/methylation domain-containing protein